LRAEIEELRNRCAELEQRNQELEGDITIMNFINEGFARESEDYKKMNDKLTEKIGPHETSSDGSNSDEHKPNPPKRRRIQPSRKAKEKAVSDESDSGEARAEMKALMKTISPEF